MSFAELAAADLVPDGVYAGGTTGSVADAPLARLLPGVGNQSGVRFNDSTVNESVRLASPSGRGNVLLCDSFGWDHDARPSADRGVRLFSLLSPDGATLTSDHEPLRSQEYGTAQVMRAWLDHQLTGPA